MRVPLVVVTGFLGAGKTTLINQLLANRAARDDSASTRKLGVIVNELGAIGIDGALLGTEASRQVELPGGCVCCVLGPELDQTLIELVGANPDLEAIVLETTGVAEPLPIAWALRRDPVAGQVRLAAVVTLVDAENFVASRKVSVSVDAQVAYADVLLVTKEPIAGAEVTARAVEAARGLAPKALVRRGTTAEHAEWLEQTLGDPALPSGAAGTGRANDGLPSGALRAPATPGLAIAANSEFHHGHQHTHDDDSDCRDVDSHAHGVDTIWAGLQQPVDVEELEDQLAELPANYVRIKGIVKAEDGGWAAVHRVGLRVSSEPFVRKPDEMLGEHGCIVALGTDVSADKLAHCLAAAYLK